MKKVTHGIEHLIARVLVAFANTLSEHGALSLGASLGAIARLLMPSRVAILRENLRLCRISFDDPERQRLFVIRVFQHIGVTILEILRQNSYRRNDFDRKISFDDLEQFNIAARTGKAVLLLSGHFGNWELLGAYARRLGYPVDLLVKRQSDERADDLMNSLRQKQGVGVIYTDTGMRALVDAVRKRRFVAILADQYGGAESETVSFFGLDTLVPSGPAVLIERYSLPFMFGTMRRAKNGLHYLSAQTITNWQGRGRLEILQAYSSMLEDAIRRSPEMWLWTHRKFKNLSNYKGGAK
ncbi:MAG: lysophospholipid acyltransferase family protein [candidate division Zixibacteria bacterium]|nr:lysophospholipid acyltransferase family protein [candidate division Zixibacteria bacterium]MBU1470338.1 lysophospholipid acyltransferase family protein [candidate division Zixibacteria bacterium]MBU2626862.1 lysophospholipid acyltransferase family protein [candidate division Zixibacteria bacterium]